MVFVNFSAHRATLKNRVIYSECATLYNYVLINKYIKWKRSNAVIHWTQQTDLNGEVNVLQGDNVLCVAQWNTIGD